MFRHLSTIQFIVYMVFAVPAQGDDNTKVFEEYLRSLSNIHGKFDARTLLENGKELTREKGEFWVSLPGKFRFDYLYGDTNGSFTVSNGVVIKTYDVELDSSYIYTLEEFTYQSPLTSVFFDGVLSQNKFNWSLRTTGEEGLVATLTPKLDNFGVQDIEIIFSSSQISSVVLRSESGISIEYNFYDLEDKPIDRKIYEMELPL